MQSSLLIFAGCFFSQVTAPAGQALKQSPHFLHFSSLTRKRIRGTQERAGQRFSLMWASYSSRKWRIVERTGLGADWPSPQ